MMLFVTANLEGLKKAGRVGEAQPPLLANNVIRIILPDCKHSHDSDGSDGNCRDMMEVMNICDFDAT